MAVRRWSVGELARASGMTVRALHYYDGIGLLSPSERTPAGHRRYTEEDVRRLYRVRALHQVGLSLDEIATTLDSADDPGVRGDVLRDLLRAQLADLDARALAITDLRSKVTAMLAQLDGPGRPEPGDFLAILEAAVPIVDPRPYLTLEQRAALAQRGRELGPDTVEALKHEWIAVVAGLRDLKSVDVPADDDRVRELARRWRDIGELLRGATRHDGQLNNALASYWRDNAMTVDQAVTDRVDGLHTGDLVAIVEYVEQALKEAGDE